MTSFGSSPCLFNISIFCDIPIAVVFPTTQVKIVLTSYWVFFLQEGRQQKSWQCSHNVPGLYKVTMRGCLGLGFSSPFMEAGESCSTRHHVQRLALKFIPNFPRLKILKPLWHLKYLLQGIELVSNLFLFFDARNRLLTLAYVQPISKCLPRGQPLL